MWPGQSCKPSNRRFSGPHDALDSTFNKWSTSIFWEIITSQAAYRQTCFVTPSTLAPPLLDSVYLDFCLFK